MLLPCRDNADTLDDAVSGILAERDVTLELVLVDDGSRDATPDRVAALAARDPRVVPLRTPGLGIVGALNLALAHARAPLLARMDGDDLSVPGRLRAQADFLGAHPDIAVVGARVAAEPAEAVGEGMRRYVDWLNGIITPEDHRRELFVESPLCHPSVMLRRSAVERVGAYREVPWPEDYDLWLRMDAAGLRLAKLDATLLAWRHRPGRLTFTHPRYGRERINEAKGHFLAARVRAMGGRLAVWGAGPTGRRIARAMEREGVRAELFVDIDPAKVGRVARGAPIVGPDALEPGRHVVVAAVGSFGAREVIRDALRRKGFVEGTGFVCAA